MYEQLHCGAGGKDAKQLGLVQEGWGAEEQQWGKLMMDKAGCGLRCLGVLLLLS